MEEEAALTVEVGACDLRNGVTRRTVTTYLSRLIITNVLMRTHVIAAISNTGDPGSDG